MRGNWGNGDSHGNSPKILSVTKTLLAIQRKEKYHVGRLANIKKTYPEFLNLDNEITLTGEKFLAKMKSVFPFL